MSISHDDFLRVLPAAVWKAARTREFSIAGRKVTIGSGRRKVEIALSQESERRIGSLRLPSTKVSFAFHGFSKGEIEQFLSRFDRVYQRGGG